VTNLLTGLQSHARSDTPLKKNDRASKIR